MSTRARLGRTGLLLSALVTGCPLTDDYFIDPSLGGGATAGNATSGGRGALAQAGAGAAASAGTTASSGVGNGGESSASAAGESNGGSEAGAAPTTPCEPVTERCNGHDDDCDDVVDEQACNSMASGTTGCAGFVVAARPMHGYMLCSSVTRDYAGAGQACMAQGMRLVWLESAAENRAVAAKTASIHDDAEVWIGASDRSSEGAWYWDGQGGIQFWNGAEDGDAVAGAYNAWASSTPNNSQQGSWEGEDCAVFAPAAAVWGDRSCAIKYAYLCEDAEP